MKILPYQLDTTNDLLTSRAGLLSIAELMNSLGLADRIDACFPQPGSNRESLKDSQIIHWYNQRAEDSENRIKELKLDFGGDTLPCSDFDANAVYFSICALAYNLFALMRQLLPDGMETSRAKTIRWRLYAMAAKVIKTGRRVFVKVQAQHQALLDNILTTMRQFELPPG